MKTKEISALSPSEATATGDCACGQVLPQAYAQFAQQESGSLGVRPEPILIFEG